MRPMPVVVLEKLLKHPLEAPLVEDEQAIEALAPARPDEALHVRVRPRLTGQHGSGLDHFLRMGFGFSWRSASSCQRTLAATASRLRRRFSIWMASPVRV
jgi:hypothetical protein